MCAKVKTKVEVTCSASSQDDENLNTPIRFCLYVSKMAVGFLDVLKIHKINNNFKYID